MTWLSLREAVVTNSADNPQTNDCYQADCYRCLLLMKVDHCFILPTLTKRGVCSWICCRFRRCTCSSDSRSVCWRADVMIRRRVKELLGQVLSPQSSSSLNHLFSCDL